MPFFPQVYNRVFTDGFWATGFCESSGYQRKAAVNLATRLFRTSAVSVTSRFRSPSVSLPPRRKKTRPRTTLVSGRNCSSWRWARNEEFKALHQVAVNSFAAGRLRHSLSCLFLTLMFCSRVTLRYAVLKGAILASTWKSLTKFVLWYVC